MSAAQLRLARVGDPLLLRGVAEKYIDWILITADDIMPLTHADVITETQATIATIAPEISPPYGENEVDVWRREIVHRWAHAMEDQTAYTFRRYYLTTHRLWTPSRR